MSGVVLKPTNKRVSTACTRCKKGKSKCSGPPAPCEACAKKGRECVFELALDGRRKESAEAALEAIQAKHRTLESLFNCLQSKDDLTVSSLVNAIREGSTLPELEKLVEGSGEDLMEVEDDAEGEVVAGPSQTTNTN